MGISTFVLGESGRGKSTAIEGLNPEDTILIKVINKPLPFRSANWKKWVDGKGSYVNTDNYADIQMIIRGAKEKGKKIVVIDDVQYLMANEFMRRSHEKGFDKFTEIAKNMWETIMMANNDTDDDVRVYFLSHTESNAEGDVKAKTIGKLLDEKITLEGMFTVVLRAMMSDGKFFFSTQNNGRDTAKSPKGMFKEKEIDNNLGLVDAAICDYYGIDNTKNKGK